MVFLPVLAAHRFTADTHWAQSAMAFIAFCLSASAVYLLNDLLDREADRDHAQKRLRPLAAGTMSVRTAIALFFTLEVTGLGLAASVNFNVLLVLVLYLLLNLLYSTVLKEQLVLDVVVLTSFYTLRIVAGGLASETSISPWLIAFSNFFFLGLAFLKRFTELRVTEGSILRRSYRPEDRLPVFVFGACCSILSVLVLVLYLNAPEAKVLYRFPERLWLLSLLMLFWNCRLWVLAHRGSVHEDPIVFAFRDRASLSTAVIAVVLLALSA